MAGYARRGRWLRVLAVVAGGNRWFTPTSSVVEPRSVEHGDGGPDLVAGESLRIAQDLVQSSERGSTISRRRRSAARRACGAPPPCIVQTVAPTTGWRLHCSPAALRRGGTAPKFGGRVVHEVGGVHGAQLGLISWGDGGSAVDRDRTDSHPRVDLEGRARRSTPRWRWLRLRLAAQDVVPLEEGEWPFQVCGAARRSGLRADVRDQREGR